MTAATRDDSRSEPEDDFDAVRWNDRAMFGRFRGLPWWATVLIAFVVAIVGTYVDVSSTAKTVGWVFAITFFLGCVGAVVFVERRSMFGPVVQPPLILAIVVPVIVVFTAGMPSGGLASMGLGLGKPLIDGFPAMAVTTACTVIIGIVRVMTQKDPNRPTKDEIREAKRKPEKPRRADRADHVDRAERPAPVKAEERPKRPRGEAPERRRPAAAPDEERPKRPRPQGAGAGSASASGDRPERPRRPAPREGGRPAPRRRRPPDEE